MLELQKASMWKRMSAALFDGILTVIVAIGAAFLISALLGYESHTQQLESYYQAYEQQYGVSLDITGTEYEALPQDARAAYDTALQALSADAQVNYTYTLLINLTFIIITFGILIGILVFELLIPLLLGNGQTLGKKIFAIAVMREDGVKLSPPLLFARTVIGKYTVETMIPVLTVVMMYFGVMGTLGVLVLLALTVMQVILLIITKANTPLHDKLAHTVTVDIASQRIFDSTEELLAYKQRVHAEAAEQAEYR